MKKISFIEIILRKVGLLDILLFLALIIVLILTTAYHPNFSKTIAKVVESLGIGIGALLAGLGGKGLLDSYVISKEKKRDDYINYFKKRYSVKRLNISFRLISCKSIDENAIYIYDIKQNSKKWIVNRYTFDTFGFLISQVKDIPQEKFEKIDWGDSINFS